MVNFGLLFPESPNTGVKIRINSTSACNAPRTLKLTDDDVVIAGINRRDLNLDFALANIEAVGERMLYYLCQANKKSRDMVVSRCVTYGDQDARHQFHRQDIQGRPSLSCS
jgi:hypothetical protein